MTPDAGPRSDAASRRAPLGHRRCDVLVVGAGPAGSAAAYWLTRAGRDVVVVEKKHFPRAKTCGDGLTPRAVRQLLDLGLGDELSGFHRFSGLRALAFGRELVLEWPKRAGFPDHGYIVTRADLDGLVAARAEKAGAELWSGAEARAPLGSDGRAGGAIVTDLDHGGEVEVAARLVVVADGANSRFGRELGAGRDRRLPLGMAIRGYYRSDRHDEHLIESHLDIRDRAGEVLPGYGWIFPLGDGRVNVGVGLLSAGERRKGVNTTELMAAFVAQAPKSWGLDEETSLGPPTGGRLPMALSVGPRVGPDYLLAGDAAAAISPFNGEGIAYGYETGRLAASVVDAALAGSDELASYETELESTYGLHYRVGAAFMAVMEHPALARRLIATGMRSKSLMGWTLRIMANMLRDDELGPAEAAYRALAGLAGLNARRSRPAA